MRRQGCLFAEPEQLQKLDKGQPDLEEALESAKLDTTRSLSGHAETLDKWLIQPRSLFL